MHWSPPPLLLHARLCCTIPLCQSCWLHVTCTPCFLKVWLRSLLLCWFLSWKPTWSTALYAVKAMMPFCRPSSSSCSASSCLWTSVLLPRFFSCHMNCAVTCWRLLLRWMEHTQAGGKNARNNKCMPVMRKTPRWLCAGAADWPMGSNNKPLLFC